MPDIQCDDCAEPVPHDIIERYSWSSEYDQQEHALDLCPECAEIHLRWVARLESDRIEEARGDYLRDTRKDIDS